MVQVVGESHYQPVIRAACSWTKPAEILFDCMAGWCLSLTTNTTRMPSAFTSMDVASATCLAVMPVSRD
jgi:hypothetical protein